MLSTFLVHLVVAAGRCGWSYHPGPFTYCIARHAMTTHMRSGTQIFWIQGVCPSPCASARSQTLSLHHQVASHIQAGQCRGADSWGYQHKVGFHVDSTWSCCGPTLVPYTEQKVSCREVPFSGTPTPVEPFMIHSNECPAATSSQPWVPGSVQDYMDMQVGKEGRTKEREMNRESC
jgi:hypothetical protein